MKQIKILKWEKKRWYRKRETWEMLVLIIDFFSHCQCAWACFWSLRNFCDVSIEIKKEMKKVRSFFFTRLRELCQYFEKGNHSRMRGDFVPF